MLAPSDLNSHQRAVLIKKWLDAGEHLTMAEIARRCGVTNNGAKYIMDAICLVDEIAEIDGKFQHVKSHCTCS